MLDTALRCGGAQVVVRGKCTHDALLAIVVLVFFTIEVLFVPQVQRMYYDEFYYDANAKLIALSHYTGICYLYSATGCATGSPGLQPQLFDEPTGWPTVLASAYAIFGVGFQTGFSTSMVLSLASLLLVFYIAYLLFGDQDVALLSSALFAATLCSCHMQGPQPWT